jgi:TBC1 domain family member 10
MQMPELVGNETQERLTEQALKLMKIENARVFKWKEMLAEYPEKKNAKLKERARKGIPDAMRGYAWKVLIDGSKHLDKSNGRDKSTLFKALMEEQGDQKLIISIFKDISRTLPEHIFFKDRFGVGQKALFCVLKALALHE